MAFTFTLLLPIQVQGSVFCCINYNRTLEVGEFFGGGVHDSYTFQCGLWDLFKFTSPGIDTRQLLVSPPKDTGKTG